ncbi:MAG TPA: putative collagen-binding domain-containing protein [Gemmatimonadaceae bacterium]|nr:putative collagen-binding domain-containing protein [Gemmatimonadaceae bacterium]
MRLRSIRAAYCALLSVIGCSSSSEQSPLVGLAITPRDSTIQTAGVIAFRAVGTLQNGSSRILTELAWQSSNPSVATINAYGTAVGVASGTAIIRVALGGLRDSTALKVENGLNVSGPLRVSTTNPRYFADPSGRIVYLTGSHYWKNVQDDDVNNPPQLFDNNKYLDFLVAHNHNFTRLWTWEQARWSDEVSYSHWFSPTIYVRTGPGAGADGGPKFDLTKFNPAFFQRLRQRVIDARARGIYVSVMLFDGWSVERKPGSAQANPWLAHPFNKDNNVNAINGDPNGDLSGRETQTLSIPAVTSLQEQYVRAVVDAVNDLDNVIYEISNESDASATQWQYHMIEFVRGYEAGKPKQHPIGMTAQWPNGTNAELLSSPGAWVSMNGDVNNPVVANGTKVSLLDTDHVCGICGDANWVWKSFTRGHNPILMDGYDNSPGVSDPAYDPSKPVWEEIRKNLGYARTYAMRMNLSLAAPRGDLASSGYCLAAVGTEYLVFLPSGGGVDVDLSGVNGSRAVEWFDPSEGRTVDGGKLTGGGIVHLSAPFRGAAVVYIRP